MSCLGVGWYRQEGGVEGKAQRGKYIANTVYTCM
jgi:hypothetical protein